MFDLGASVVLVRNVGRFPPGTKGWVQGRAVDGAYYHVNISGAKKLLTCRSYEIVLESEYKPEERRQCPICERWDRAKSFSTQFDRCSSCLEDMETEDMEEWIRVDFNSRCTL